MKLKLENLQPGARSRSAACGVSLAVAYLDHPAIAAARDVVIVVCGGVSISARQVADWNASLPG